MLEQKALSQLLEDVTPDEYLQLLRTLNNAYLENISGSVDMDVIYQVQKLEDYMRTLDQVSVKE